MKFCCEQSVIAYNNAIEQEKAEELALFFKIFSDPTRIRILCALKESELCVCDLSLIVGMEQSAISHQLRLLKEHRIVSVRKEGKMSFYSLDDHHIFEILTDGLEHLAH